MSGWFGKRFALKKFRASRKRTSASLSFFSLKRTPAKLFIEVPMSGWFGKRFAFAKFRASLQRTSASFS